MWNYIFHKKSRYTKVEYKEIKPYHFSKSLSHKDEQQKKKKILKTIKLKKKIKISGISLYLSMITLNANGLNLPIKRYNLAKWILNLL
jgi:dethiobiotin synthetase